MRFLILNQTFHPDLQASAQHATDVARELVCQGHEVTVIAGARAYGRPEVVYPARETWQGVDILRVGALDFGKRRKWQRALNFASFLFAVAWKLLWLPPPVEQRACKDQGLRTKDQGPRASNQPPATSNQPPATSHQPPEQLSAVVAASSEDVENRQDLRGFVGGEHHSVTADAEPVLVGPAAQLLDVTVH